MPPIALGKIRGLNSFQENMGGCTGRWFIILADDITTEGQIQYDRNIAANAKEVVAIQTAHVPASGKGFLECYNTQNKGKVMLKPTGERDARGIEASAEFYVPGDAFDNFGNLHRAMNDRVIVIAEMMNGKMFQIGTKRLPAELTYEFDSGTNSGGYKGVKVAVSNFEVSPIMYDAAIPLQP